MMATESIKSAVISECAVGSDQKSSVWKMFAAREKDDAPRKVLFGQFWAHNFG